MPAHEDQGAGGPPGPPDEPGDGRSRNHRIDELRAELERLQARVAAEMAQQRRAAMKLQALLDEKRHIARQARREERAARWRQHRGDDRPRPAPEGPRGRPSGPRATPAADGTDGDPELPGGEP